MSLVTARPRRRGIARLLASAAALALAGGGCSLIVSGDVPEFHCQGTDPSACPSGMSCDVTKALCVATIVGPDAKEASDDGPNDPDASDDAKDADAGGPADLGVKCRIDADCKSRLCASSAVLTTAIAGTTGPICTIPCCNSTECAPSFVCFNGGTGGGYCVPSTLAQRTPPATGGKGGGLTCSTNTDCRSGICTGSPKQCLDTCCSQAECGGTSVCRVKSVSAPAPSHDVWVCANSESGATTTPGMSCAGGNSDCTTDACLGIPGKCRPPCSNTASCRVVAGFPGGHCLYGSSGPDYFKFCQLTTDGTRSAVGVACSDDGTCQSDFCDPEQHKCANVCARDSDCAANEACRPSGTNTPYLRCVLKP